MGDAMRLGGNGNARSYFRKHGFTDLYGGKSDKKYKSKAALSYRSELKKTLDEAAAKRGKNENGKNDDDFEDVETTQKAMEEVEKNERQIVGDEALAKKLQTEMNLNERETDIRESSGPTQPIEKVSTPSVNAMNPTTPKVSAKEANMAKLKDMTSDFFSDM